MSVEQSVGRELAGETEVLGENLPQCHFIYYKSYMTWQNPGRRGWKPATNHLSYGTGMEYASLEELLQTCKGKKVKAIPVTGRGGP
jgi:hypothetical protein